jgi:hypothetical protein
MYRHESSFVLHYGVSPHKQVYISKMHFLLRRLFSNRLLFKKSVQIVDKEVDWSGRCETPVGEADR